MEEAQDFSVAILRNPFHPHQKASGIVRGDQTIFSGGNKLVDFYHKNRSLFTLISGTAAGILSAGVLLLLTSPVLGEEISLSFALIVLNWGLFTGGFVGGIVGLFAHRGEWNLGRTLGVLGAFFGGFLVLLLVGVLIQLMASN